MVGVPAEYRYFAVVVPAGTTQASPAVTELAMPARIVRTIRWRVPPGPQGQLGWQLTSGGEAVIPAEPATYIVADDEADELAPDSTIETGAWQVTAYNTGLYDHTLYLAFGLDPVGLGGPPLASTPLPITP